MIKRDPEVEVAGLNALRNPAVLAAVYDRWLGALTDEEFLFAIDRILNTETENLTPEEKKYVSDERAFRAVKENPYVEV